MALVACVASSGPTVAGPASAGARAVAPEQQNKRVSDAPQRTISLPELRARLNESDRRVALAALHVALSQVGDGMTYVWRRRSRNLTGMIKPTSAFRDASGQICRHVIYTLSLGRYSRRVEGIACREISGRWTITS